MLSPAWWDCVRVGYNFCNFSLLRELLRRLGGRSTSVRLHNARVGEPCSASDEFADALKIFRYLTIYRTGLHSGRHRKVSVMVTFSGISGIPEPKPERPTRVRESGQTNTPAPADGGSNETVSAEDVVRISSEAQAAAQLTRLLQQAQTQEAVRPERVEAARQSIERGDYRNPEIVTKIAERILRFLR